MWFLALETHAVTWLAGAGEDLLALQGLHQVQQAVLERKYFFQRNDKHFKSGEYIDQHESIYYCPSDGWWQHKIYERQDEAPKNWHSIIHEGILKTYDLDSSVTSTEVLNDYIYHHPEKIVTMHHKKWKNWLLLFSVIFITVKQKSLENHQMTELILF